MAKQIPNITIRGIRKGIPTGYLVGRTAKGSGPPHLLNLTQLRRFGIGGVNKVGAAGATAHGFGFFAQGLLGAGEILGHASFPQDVTFVTGDPRTLVTARIAATVDSDLLLQDLTGVPLTVATIHFAAGLTTAVVTFSPDPYAQLAGHPFQLVAPASADTTLADISGTVTGNG